MRKDTPNRSFIPVPKYYTVQTTLPRAEESMWGCPHDVPVGCHLVPVECIASSRDAQKYGTLKDPKKRFQSLRVNNSWHGWCLRSQGTRPNILT